MNSHRIPLAAAATLALAALGGLPGAAVASWHDRACSQPGLVFGRPDANGTDPYEDKSRFHVSITPATVAAIARSWVPLGLRPRAHAVPCIAATSIVATASQSWLHWRGDSGRIKVVSGTAINYTTYPVGRFRCTSTALRAPLVATVRCVGHRGAIVATFTIEQNPNAH